MTPQVRSRLNLAERGYLVGTVEGKKKFPDRKKAPCGACKRQYMIEISTDLWQIFDVIAEHPQARERVYVQVTDYTSHSKRRNKILAAFEAKLVLMAGAKILIQSWRKNKSNRFELREEWITLKDFESAPHYPNTVAELIAIRKKEKEDNESE